MSDSSLKKCGIYTIRLIPKGIKTVDFAGGLYATAPSNIGEPIKAESLVPSATGTQAWQVEKIEGTDKYTITTVSPSVEGIPPAVIAWQHNKIAVQGEPIIYGAGNEFSTYWISPADLSGTYHINVDPGVEVLGVRYAVADSDLNELVIKTYPVIAEPVHVPRWQFIPVEATKGASTS
ncbi:hypothetical protein BDQ12DRAFT_749892 [Crucibulum laeve]|uniref:Uncharacterized protein n=1 Tax=Crucibulum laeve TaxID=68775 RepID=A0A5C3LYM1_9AGAR|nr:hypothetical protein BDQ12DRAFT_749892 [Crucibulum laeve]